jgi:hypothetical protein
MTISESPVGLGFTDADIRVFEDNDLNKKQAPATTKGIMRTLTYNEQLLKGKRCLSCHTAVLDFFKSSTGTHLSPPALLDVGDHVSDDMMTVQVEVPHL